MNEANGVVRCIVSRLALKPSDTAWRVALLLGCATFAFPGMFMAPGKGLDPSWKMGMNYAVSHDMVFGRQIAFTYGPLGFVLWPLDMGDNPVYAVCFRLAVFGSWCLALGLMLFHIKSLASVTLFAFICVFFSGLSAYDLTDDWLTAVAGFLLVSHYASKRAWSIPAFVLSAAAVLAKFNIGVVCTVMVCVWAMLYFVRRPRSSSASFLILMGALYTGTLLGCFVAYGGPPGALADFLRTSIHIAGGYSAQMALHGPKMDMILAGAMMSLLLVGFITGCLWSYRYLGAVLLLLFPLFAMFKSGFVRHDSGHALIFFSVAPQLVAYFLLVAKRRWERFAIGVTVIAMANSSVAWRIRQWPRADLVPRGYTHIAELWNWTTSRASNEATAADLDRQQRLPATFLDRIGTEPVDVYPWDISVAIANGLNWSPRLVLQSYSAYDPTLDDLSAAHYRGPDAPRFILYRHQAIDGQYPCAVDPATWMEILRWYEPVDRNEETLLLERRESRRFGDPIELGSQVIGFGERWEVPRGGTVPIMLKARMGLNWHGWIMDKVYKVYPPRVIVEYRDGSTRTYRLVWRNAQSGFLVSHMPRALVGADMLFCGEAPDAVLAITFKKQKGYFRKGIQLSWSELSYKFARHGSDADSLLKFLESVFDPPFVTRKWITVDGHFVPVFFQHAPSRVSVEVEVTKRYLSFGYGLERGAYDKSDGVGYTLDVMLDGQTTKLFSKEVRPLVNPSDRTWQYDVVDLGRFVGKTVELMFITEPLESTAYDWSMWLDPRLVDRP